jgi:alkanesulfonate monooxygenase
MSIQIYWQIDIAAEPRRNEASAWPALPTLVRDRRQAAQNRFDYYAQIATAARHTGFDGLYLPYRREGDDAGIVAGALAREVPKLQLVAGFPASVGSAVYAAKQATSFQRSTHNRLGWAIAPDADAATRAAEGDHVPEEELGARLEEFLTVARGVHGRRPFSFQGRYLEVANGGFEAPLSGSAFPPVFLQGEGEEDLQLSARLGDVHLFAAAAPEHLASLIEGLDSLAGAAGRSLGYGLIQPVLARETSAEAARDAARTPLPAGALVGSWDEVAGELATRVALGIDRLILAGDRQIEDAYELGQQLLPRLRAVATRRAA